MPRVHFVKSARKDHGSIKKGESYYWWKFRYGGRRVSKTRPRPSQLTQSKLSQVYAAVESIEDAIASARGDEDFESAKDTLTSALDNARDEAQEVADEYRESAESIRGSFSESATADECDEKADEIEGWCEALDTAKDDIDGIDDEGDDPVEEMCSLAEEACSAQPL